VGTACGGGVGKGGGGRGGGGGGGGVLCNFDEGSEKSYATKKKKGGTFSFCVKYKANPHQKKKKTEGR